MNSDPVWYVLYTKPRNEKKVLQLLTLKGFNCYCPCQRVLKQWSDRKKWVEEPVFKSYIFVQIAEFSLKKIPILQTPGVVRFLFWLGNPAQVKQLEIEAIQSFLEDHNTNRMNILTVGSHVRINDGLLKGIDGEVDYQTENDVVLKIEKLGMSLIARVPKDYVESRT
jgi:transcription antitermination factor NusG